MPTLATESQFPAMKLVVTFRSVDRLLQCEIGLQSATLEEDRYAAYA